MVNGITILLFYVNFSEIMDVDYIAMKQWLHNRLSEYFCTFKFNILDNCKIMFVIVFVICICKIILSELTFTICYISFSNIYL